MGNTARSHGKRLFSSGLKKLSVGEISNQELLPADI
jgi:hypothetical protein